jgi:hypothetical protein
MERNVQNLNEDENGERRRPRHGGENARATVPEGQAKSPCIKLVGLVSPRFVTELKLRRAYDPKTGCLRLGGLFEAYGPITEADIADARREMWGEFGGGDAAR